MKLKLISDNQIHEARIKVPANPKRTLSFRECQAVAGEQLTHSQKQVDEREKQVVNGIFKEIDNLIIGIAGCKFEERLDGDKGCIELDMNENQWQSFKAFYLGKQEAKDGR